MAKQTSLLKFRGKLGDLIGYKVGKTFYVRSAPELVHQTYRTQIASGYFGKASRLGAVMRRAMKGMLHVPSEPGAVNSLNKALLHVLRQDDMNRRKQFIPRNFGELQGFSFTPHASLDRVLEVKPTIVRDYHGRLHVTVPAIGAHACNPRATHVCIRAVAVHVHPGRTTATASASEPVLLSAGEPSEAFTLVVPGVRDVVSCVILEVTSVQEEHGRYYQLQNRKYSAAEVIAVLGPKSAQAMQVHSPYASRMRQRLPLVEGLIIHPMQRE